MRAGSLARVWQMSQQCSCSNLDSLRYHPAKSICLSSEIFFFFYISPPLVGCEQDWAGQRWSLDEELVPPPEGMSLDTPPAKTAKPQSFGHHSQWALVHVVK